MKDKKRGIIEKRGERFTGFQPLFSWDLVVNLGQKILYTLL